MTGRVRVWRGKQRQCEGTVGFDERRHMLIRCKEQATCSFLPDDDKIKSHPVWIPLCDKCLLGVRCEGDITP